MTFTALHHGFAPQGVFLPQQQHAGKLTANVLRLVGVSSVPIVNTISVSDKDRMLDLLKKDMETRSLKSFSLHMLNQQQRDKQLEKLVTQCVVGSQEAGVSFF
jgi:hypothetical protein